MSLTFPIGLMVNAVPHARAKEASAPFGTGSADASANGAGSLSGALPANMQISQSGFLRLISTQMQNQDPLNPTDPTQFLAQVEGLSEVSSLQSLQNTMSGLAAGLQASQVLSGTSLLGHSVLAAGSTATIDSGGTVSGAVAAPTGTNQLAVSVTDANGTLINSFNVAPAASGFTPFTWDGTTSSGGAAPAGQYSITVNAALGNSYQPLSPLLYSKVTSVTLDPATQTLQINTPNGAVALGSVVSIQ
jgi:flagellar basal-body rod modification protein FlgD